MSATLVAVCYGSAAILSLGFLWYFGVKHWYWHVFSLVAALALGLARLPDPFNQPTYTLGVGWVFTFLFLWGVAAPVVAALKHSPDIHLRHHH